MGKFNYLQTNFRSGEVTPRVHYSFADTRVRDGLKTLNNFLIFQQGGITKRQQSTFVAPVKDSSAITRVIPFEFNKDSENIYVIELGNLYARFFKNNAQIREASSTISGATAADPVVVTDTGHGYSNGDHVFIDDIVGMTELNARWFIVSNKNTNDYELTDLAGTDIDGSGYTAYSSAGISEKVYEIVTPYTSAQVNDVQFVQSADVVYMVHGSHEPRELARSGDTSWAIKNLMDFTTANFFKDGPYLDENISTTTLALSGTSGSVTVTASAITGINGNTGFQTTDVGRLIQWHDGTDFTWLYITARASTTSITATIAGADAAITTGTIRWRLGAWSDTTGFPGVIAFYQNRLVFAATDTQPDTLWGSSGTDYLGFAPGTDSIDPYNFTLSLSGSINRIVWIDPQIKLRIGTLGYIATLGDPTTDVSAKLEANVSCDSLIPVKIDTSTIFTQRGANIVRSLVAGDFTDDNLTAVEASILSEHMVKQGIVDSAFQEVPHSTVWYALTDGTLAAFTHNKVEKIFAWHRHAIGGTSAAVKSLTAIPSGSASEVWSIVARTIGGATHQYVEYLEQDFSGTDTTTAKFLDGGKTITNSPASVTVGELWHLEGQTVQVLADGYTVPDKTVTNGTITLPKAAESITVGFNYTAELDMLPVDAGSRVGSGTGSKARTKELIFKLADTVGGEAGLDSSNTSTITFRKPGDAMDTAVPLFTGEKRVTSGRWGQEASGYIKQDQPLPMTVYAATVKIEINDN